jgi:prolyl 4-hydroxylase
MFLTKAQKILLFLSIVVILFGLIWFYRSSLLKETYSNSYNVQEIENLLTPEECDQLIEFSRKKGMKESDVLSYGHATDTVVDKHNRTSKTAWLQDTEHPIAMKVATLSEELTKIPRENQEMLQVAYYEPGGKFNEHYDACNESNKEYCDKMNHYAGHRWATLLIYLNDNFDGGETEFPLIHKKIAPKKGKGILFWNTYENEVIIPESRHKGNPVEHGEKWICTKWSHFKKYV